MTPVAFFWPLVNRASVKEKREMKKRRKRKMKQKERKKLL